MSKKLANYVTTKILQIYLVSCDLGAFFLCESVFQLPSPLLEQLGLIPMQQLVC